MFEPGEMIMYGSSGVCRVEAVGQRDIAGEDRLYYTLSPVYSTETIFVPVDTTVFMRPVLSREQAEELIDQIPSIRGDACQERNLSLLTAHYQTALRSHDCRDLIQLVKSVYAKHQLAAQRGKKLGQVDQRYGKRAGELLHGELAVALGIPWEEITGYIEKRLAALSGTDKTDEQGTGG